MAFQTIFKRYELKYIISREQKEKILNRMAEYMEPDSYGMSTVRNVYFDTDNYRLIRHSMDKPDYKEKLRIRSYVKASSDTTVFVELKKKYDSVVYKRRAAMTEKEAVQWICEGKHCQDDTQIVREIDYFLSYYGDLAPKVLLSYEREAYFARDGSDFRVTFDANILCRRDDISLESDIYGESILDSDYVLMELKSSGGIPLWMVHLLTEMHIYKTSFSKYGTAYTKLIFGKE